MHFRSLKYVFIIFFHSESGSVASKSLILIILGLFRNLMRFPYVMLKYINFASMFCILYFASKFNGKVWSIYILLNISTVNLKKSICKRFRFRFIIKHLYFIFCIWGVMSIGFTSFKKVSKVYNPPRIFDDYTLFT